MKLDAVLLPHGPWLHVLLASEADTYDAMGALQRSSQGRTQCRVVRGHKATTVAAFFDECAAAWQFPDYFGENWNALDECLGDLAWLPADSYVFAVNQAIHLLEKEPKEQISLLLSLLEDRAREWSQPTPESPATTFHVLLQGTNATQLSLEHRLQAAGVDYNLIPGD
jgi:hypothetical protein